MHYLCLVSWSWKMMIGWRQKKLSARLVMQLKARTHMPLFLWYGCSSVHNSLHYFCIPNTCNPVPAAIVIISTERMCGHVAILLLSISSVTSYWYWSLKCYFDNSFDTLAVNWIGKLELLCSSSQWEEKSEARSYSFGKGQRTLYQSRSFYLSYCLWEWELFLHFCCYFSTFGL